MKNTNLTNPKDYASKVADGVKNVTDKLKKHDFKADLHDGASMAKEVAGQLKQHDFRAEVRDAFAEAKKKPSSIWEKPDAMRPGKELAIAGLAIAVVLLLLLWVTTGAFIGFLCLIIALGGLLLSLLGLKTEGRKIAIGGAAVGLLVVVCAFGQMFGGGGSFSGGSGKGGKYAIKEANEGEKASSASKVIAMAKNAKAMKSLNFYGFYTGMSVANAQLLREHYGLTKDHLWFYYNKENGEVYKMWFTPKALTTIMDVVNNFETVELTIQDYLEIVAWNNEKEVIEGEIDSMFQDEGDKFWFGDKADVVRWYKTADGVAVKLYPNQKAWNSGKGVLQIYDSERGKKAMAFNLPFENNQKMREELAALKKNGVKTMTLQLPRGFEWLMKEFHGSWVGALPMTEAQRILIFHGLENTTANRAAMGFEKGKLAKEGITAIVKDFNDLSNDAKQGLQFRLPFPEEKKEIEDAGKSKADGIYIIGEGEEAAKKNAARLSLTEINSLNREAWDAWLRYSNDAANLRASGKSDDEIIVEGFGDTEEKFREGFCLERGIIRDGEKFISIEKDEKDKRTKEFVKQKNEAKAAAKERIEEKAKQAKAAEERAQRDKAEIDKARAEKRAVEKIIPIPVSANLGELRPNQMDSLLPNAPLDRLNLVRRVLAYLDKTSSTMSWIEENNAKQNDPGKMSSQLKNIMENVNTYRSMAIEYANECEKRESANRETAQQLKGTAPEEAIKIWLSAAEMLKTARLQYLDLAEKCAKMLDRINAMTPTLQ